MASVVFLRGVNVGGHRKFQPSVLARELADFGAVNIGAAGTLVIQNPIAQKALREEFRRRLPFEAEIMICPARELLALIDSAPFAKGPDGRPFVTAMAKTPRPSPTLPIERPKGGPWQVKIIAIRGRFALSLWRRQGKRLIYPNEVVEKNLGVAATTRNWDTILAIDAILRRDVK